MTSTYRRWLYYGLIAASFICSFVQFYTLWAMEKTPDWSKSLSILSICMISTALTLRPNKA